MSAFDLDEFDDVTPVIYVLSDARGETANAVVRAAAAQFDAGAVEIVRVSNVTSAEMLRTRFDEVFEPDVPCAVFHTIADTSLRRQVRRVLDDMNIPSIDLLGPAVSVISTLTGLDPSCEIGATLV